MCYSAQIEADYRKYVHMFGAQMSIREFARLYWERAEGSKANVPKAMDDAFSNPQTAYFTPSWTRISQQAGQAFHTKLDTDFTASWTAISRQAGQ